MEFKEISEEEYKNFFNNFKYPHFLQSTTWGKVNKETRGKEPIYVGLIKDNKIIGGALLLKKKMPFNLCYYYAPRGYLIDYKDNLVVEEFTLGMKKFLKDTNGIYVKINPEIMYQEIDSKGERIPNSKNNIDIYGNLISLGYIHQGFVKLYENNEPRYTFRRYFDKYNSLDEINNSISKSFLANVKRSYNYNMEIDFNGSIDTFSTLNRENSLKDDFIAFPDKFYKTLYKYGKENNNLLVFNCIVNPKELYDNTKKEYDILESAIKNQQLSRKALPDAIDKKNRLEKDLKYYEPYRDKERLVICSLLNGIADKDMWTMYIGNNRLGEHLFAVNRIYYETIKYCYENGYHFLDLYGTSGDPNTTYKNLGGLHHFKSQYGDTYIEFIGEFDLINKKFLYKILPYLLKVYRYFYRLLKKNS